LLDSDNCTYEKHVSQIVCCILLGVSVLKAHYKWL